LIEVLLFYVEKGASIIRLDAIAYLWKAVGTPCIHLPQTHVIIQVMRAVLDEIAPQVILITETNVPHQENISYFGDGYNEAQMVYNFTLPPLLMYTLLHGTVEKFRHWVNTLNTPSDQTTFFNFTASHDGIGIRPVEGLLTSDEVESLIQKVLATGGRINVRQDATGKELPYELNVSYVDAIIDPQASLTTQVRQFLLSQGIQLALAGVPAIYIHSLLGSRNALDWMRFTGHNRAINRAKFDLAEIESALQQAQSFRAQVFKGYLDFIKVRRTQAAFHPNSPQTALDMGTDGVLGLLRGSDLTGRILALFNVSNRTQTVTLAENLAGIDLLSGRKAAGIIALEPYQQAWILLDHT
jgi:sucrose phosphorylase